MHKRPVVRQEVPQPLDQSYRYIPLTRGQIAIVDAEDFNWLSQWNWWANKTHSGTYTPTRHSETKNGKRLSVSMARTILGMTKRWIDHRNGDPLDNRKENLRKCTQPQNAKNRKLDHDSSSGYKGVSWHKHRKLWNARITINRKTLSLGYFPSIEKAAQVYDQAAQKYHGEFAHLNFP